MRRLVLTFILALLLLEGAAQAGISTDVGVTTLYFCHEDGVILEIDSALSRFSEDQAKASPYALAVMVLRDQSVITVGDGSTDTGFCGVLPVGKSEWRVGVSSGIGGSFRDGVNGQLGYSDIDPSDGLDDSTELSPNAFLDAYLKAELRALVLRQRKLDNPPPAIPPDFDLE